jgi:hypothetical protein
MLRGFLDQFQVACQWLMLGILAVVLVPIAFVIIALVASPEKTVPVINEAVEALPTKVQEIIPTLALPTATGITAPTEEPTATDQATNTPTSTTVPTNTPTLVPSATMSPTATLSPTGTVVVQNNAYQTYDPDRTTLKIRGIYILEVYNTFEHWTVWRDSQFNPGTEYFYSGSGWSQIDTAITNGAYFTGNSATPMTGLLVCFRDTAITPKFIDGTTSFYMDTNGFSLVPVDWAKNNGIIGIDNNGVYMPVARVVPFIRGDTPASLGLIDTDLCN